MDAPSGPSGTSPAHQERGDPEGKRGGLEGLQRLTQPLVRDAGHLRAASWDEALDRAAAGFEKARALGPNGFGMFSCSKTTNEMNFMAQKFTRVVMGSNNIDSCNRT
jgi:predicted molibdopterin-dependent oxidoreductase YjgC